MDQMLFNPQQMQTIGDLPLFMMGKGRAWMNQAQQADQATLAELMQERQRKSQEFDSLQKQRQATLEGTMLNNQGTQLTNEGLGMTNQARKATLPQEIQSKLDNFAKTADDTKWSAFENKIKTGMASDDPKIRAQAMAVYERLPAAVDARRKHQFTMEHEREATKRAYGVASMNNAAAAERAKASGTKPVDPARFKRLMDYYTFMANQLEDGPARDALLAKAEAEWQKEQIKIRQQAIAAQSGKIDPTQLPGSELKTNPLPESQPMPRPESKPAQQYQAGQTYKGSTGTYRYKGGDPKNKANWEKVE